MVTSMFAAVAGLRTHQSRMDVIGNNIANVNTFGFKKARATFRDQFYATMTGSSDAGTVFGGGNPSQVGYGVNMASVDVNFTSGSMQPTGFGMDAMIQGNGFFLVGQYAANGFDRVSNALSPAGVPSPNISQLNKTRVGIFNIDGRGNLVDSQRNFVFGFWEHSQLDNPDRLEMLSVPNILMHENGDPVVIVDGEGNERFLTIPFQLQPPVAGAAPAYYLDSNDNRMLVGMEDGDDPTEPRFLTAATRTAILEAANAGLPAGSPAIITEAMLTTAIGPVDGDDAQRVYMEPMSLVDISIGADGLVRGTNDLREIVRIGYIAVANVPNPNGLTNVGNGYFRAEANTGVVSAWRAGEGTTGAISAGWLEMANVDLAQEFTDMIITQRGFQANGRIITVTDEMLAELVNLKR